MLHAVKEVLGISYVTKTFLKLQMHQGSKTGKSEQSPSTNHMKLWKIIENLSKFWAWGTCNWIPGVNALMLSLEVESFRNIPTQRCLCYRPCFGYNLCFLKSSKRAVVCPTGNASFQRAPQALENFIFCLPASRCDFLRGPTSQPGRPRRLSHAAGNGLPSAQGGEVARPLRLHQVRTLLVAPPELLHLSSGSTVKE